MAVVYTCIIWPLEVEVRFFILSRTSSSLVAADRSPETFNLPLIYADKGFRCPMNICCMSDTVRSRVTSGSLRGSGPSPRLPEPEINTRLR